jgi:nucleoside-diphosphate-sugar epimerase
MRVADACVQTGAALLSLSTTSVYGKQAELVDETCSDEDLQPQSPYAESKLRAERYLLKLGEEKGLRFNTLRFGTIFGPSPGMRFHTAVNKFIWQANLGQPITIWRTALHQKRPYLDLSDAVFALGFLICEKIYKNEVFNVLTLNATPKEITDAISEFSGPLSIEFVDSEIMNQLSYEVDRRKFESLGFEFKGDLVKGIGSTLQLLSGIRV